MSENIATLSIDQLTEIMVDKFGVARDQVTAQTVLESLDLDSLALVELFLVLKKRCGVDISTDEITTDNTVGDLAAFLANGDADR